MAGDDINQFYEDTPGEYKNLKAQFNLLVDDLETLRAKYHALLAKLDADAGVTDANYVGTLDVAAADLTAAKVNP